MKTKSEIVGNWLPRYTGTSMDEFGEYVLLTNFSDYLEMFAEMHKVEIKATKEICQAQQPKILL